MKWPKVLNQDILYEFNDLSNKEFVTILKYLALISEIEKIPEQKHYKIHIKKSVLDSIRNKIDLKTLEERVINNVISYKNSSEGARIRKQNQRKRESENNEKHTNSLLNEKNVTRDVTEKSHSDVTSTPNRDVTAYTKENYTKKNNNSSIQRCNTENKELLSTIIKILEDLEFKMNPIQYLAAKPDSLIVIAEYYTGIQCALNKNKGKEFNRDKYLRSVCMALQGKNDWDVNNLLKDVENDARNRFKRSLDAKQKQFDDTECEKKKNREKILFDFAMAEFKILPLDEREDLEKESFHIVKSQMNGTFKIKKGTKFVDDRVKFQISKSMYEQSFCKEEDALA